MSDRGKLRKFGLIMAAAFAVVTALLLLRGVGAWPYTAGISGLFILSGLLLPGLLGPVEWVWMKFAHVLGFVVTNVLLTLVFFIGVTLTGLVMRLLGKDPLGLGSRGDRYTYWHEVDPDGPCGRPDKPY